MSVSTAFPFTFPITFFVFCTRTFLIEGDMGICGVAVLMFFYYGDAVNKISFCGVTVISNPSVCDVQVVFFTLRCSVK